MKKIILVVMIVLLAMPAFATNEATKASGNTVSFSTVDLSVGRDVRIVTFNSVTTHIKITNLSVLDDCYVDILCKDANGKRGYSKFDNCTVLVPALGRQSPNTIEFNFATHNLGFVASPTSGATGTWARDLVTYSAIGEQEAL